MTLSECCSIGYRFNESLDLSSHTIFWVQYWPNAAFVTPIYTNAASEIPFTCAEHFYPLPAGIFITTDPLQNEYQQFTPNLGIYGTHLERLRRAVHVLLMIYHWKVDGLCLINICEKPEHRRASHDTIAALLCYDKDWMRKKAAFAPGNCSIVVFTLYRSGSLTYACDTTFCIGEFTNSEQNRQNVGEIPVWCANKFVMFEFRYVSDASSLSWTQSPVFWNLSNVIGTKLSAIASNRAKIEAKGSHLEVQPVGYVYKTSYSAGIYCKAHWSPHNHHFRYIQ